MIKLIAKKYENRGKIYDAMIQKIRIETDRRAKVFNIFRTITARINTIAKKRKKENIIENQLYFQFFSMFARSFKYY